ncbi:MAG: DUF4153 domain-containing protein [Planctomycetota bacterium]
MEDSETGAVVGTGPARSAASKTARPSMTAIAAWSLLIWTVLSDWLLYRSAGYAGPAVFFAMTPAFFLLPLRRKSKTSPLRLAPGFCCLLILGVATRLVVLGNAWVFVSGIVCTFAVALASSHVFPWALETVSMFVRAPLDGVICFCSHRLPSISGGTAVSFGSSRTANWLLPLAITGVFGGVFVLANPDLVQWVSARFTETIDWTWQWVGQLSAWEIPFCILSLIVGAGLLYPVYGKMRIGGEDNTENDRVTAEAPLYVPIRNTLFCLVLLFTIYLVFEFWTLWKRDFPDGFYYAGYAHQGAAWLTVALALATGLLSVIFSGATLNDHRIKVLKTLAWSWSALNFLLAIAVYNRLSIYVGYNGLTPMRIAGYFGITAVVAGFSLVVVKVAKCRGFWWLLRTQLTALLLTVVLFALFPVDFVAHQYNASRIKAGYLHPSVMIAVKPMDDLGYLTILDLVDCEDVTIREGVRAMIAERQVMIEAETQNRPWHWTRFQAETDRLYEKMSERETTWARYRANPALREAIRSRFERYAMRWY